MLRLPIDFIQTVNCAAVCLLQLDGWMEAHEAAEAAREAARQAAMAEDGWTVVVRSKVSSLQAKQRDQAIAADVGTSQAPPLPCVDATSAVNASMQLASSSKPAIAMHVDISLAAPSRSNDFWSCPFRRCLLLLRLALTLAHGVAAAVGPQARA